MNGSVRETSVGEYTGSLIDELPAQVFASAEKEDVDSGKFNKKRLDVLPLSPVPTLRI